MESRAPEGVLQDDQQSVHQDVPQDVHQNAQQDVQHDVHQEAQQDARQDVHQADGNHRLHETIPLEERQQVVPVDRPATPVGDGPSPQPSQLLRNLQRAHQQEQRDAKVGGKAPSQDHKADSLAAAMGKEPQATPKHEVQPLVLGDAKVAVVPAKAKEKEDPSAPAKRYSPFIRQAFAASGPIIVTISSGMTTGYSAVLLPQLQHPNSTIPITNNQASWIASMAPLPMVLGCFLVGVLQDRLGCRRTQLAICVPFAVGWMLLALAGDLSFILVGRFLTGLCVGLVGPPAMIYIGETASPSHRGLLLGGLSLAVAVGILLAHVLGSLLHWRLTAWLCGTAPIACFALLCPSPESPVWLASKGRLDEASRAFRWLRGFGDAASLELRGMMSKHAAVETPLPAASTTTASQPANGDAVLPLYRQLLQRSFLKPFFIMTTFFFVQQFSGVNAVAFYTVTIMKDVGGGVDEYVATITLDVVRVLVSCVACVLLRRTGRRPLAVLSAAVTGVSLLGLAAVLAFGDPAKYPWLPTTLLVVYIMSLSLGLVPLPWVMAGEVFPASLRGVGGGATSACAFLFLFTVVKTGPQLFEALTPAGTFGAYGTVALCGAVFLFACLPETKNKTLQEIEELMAGPSLAHRRKQAALAEP